MTLSTMPTIRFGVIPFEATLPLAPVHGWPPTTTPAGIQENSSRIFPDFPGRAR